MPNFAEYDVLIMCREYKIIKTLAQLITSLLMETAATLLAKEPQNFQFYTWREGG
jgi:hypothetical protein